MVMQPAGEPSLCVSCDGRHLVPLFPYPLDQPTGASLFEGRKLVRCSACGLRQIDPVPSADELRHYYETTYRADGSFMKVDGDRFPFDSGWYLSRGRAVRHFTLSRGWQPPVDRRPSILDVGAGFGHVLHAFREEIDADLFATEPDPVCAPFLERAGVVRLPHEDDVPAGGRRFDLIVLTHALEHMRRPARVLARLGALLEEDGRIVIEVPNCVQEFAAQWAYVPHITFFDSDGLLRVVEQAGGRVCGLAVSGPLYDRPTWKRFVPAALKRLARPVRAAVAPRVPRDEDWRDPAIVPIRAFGIDGPGRIFLRALVAFD